MACGKEAMALKSEVTLAVVVVLGSRLLLLLPCFSEKQELFFMESGGS